MTLFKFGSIVVAEMLVELAVKVLREGLPPPSKVPETEEELRRVEQQLKLEKVALLRSLGLTFEEVSFYLNVPLSDPRLRAAIARRALLVKRGVVSEEKLVGMTHYELSLLEDRVGLLGLSSEELERELENRVL